MIKTFITKYPSSLDKADLPYYNSITVLVKGSKTADHDRKIEVLSNTEGTPIEVIAKNGENLVSLDNKTFSSSVKVLTGQAVYFAERSAGDYEVIIRSKYNIRDFIVSKSNNSDVTLNLNDFKFSNEVRNIRLNHDDNKHNNPYQNYGNLSAFANKPKLEQLYLAKTMVEGDIANLANDKGLTFLMLFNETSVTGDISALSGLTKLSVLNIANTSIAGDISALSGLPLKNLDISKTITMTDAQKKEFTDKGCTITIH